MDEEEHEVYGGDIPVEGDLEGDLDAHNPDVDMSTADDDAVKVFFLFWNSKFRRYFGSGILCIFCLFDLLICIYLI